ncbi:MAG: RDD family protein [Terracidiphilus sp.]
MSTSVHTATLFPSWKQEVNRRVAAHLSQKTHSAGEANALQESRPALESRAAQAAARVAERYAHAPSYSEMLADEARAAVRAAEAASKAAQQAHAAAQYVLAGLEAVSSPAGAWQPEAVTDRTPEHKPTPARRPSRQQNPGLFLFHDGALSADRSEPEPAAKAVEPSPAPANRREHGPVIVETRAAEWDEPDLPISNAERAGMAQAGEAAHPIYANLIEFPREMVATRKMRPRRAEGPLAAAAPEAQLSIFEVDPGTISTLPAAAVDEPAAPEWMRTEFSSIELGPQRGEELLEEPAPEAPSPATVKLAPMSRRVMAVVVDLSLIVAAFLAAAMPAASHARHLPGLRTVELGAALAILAVGAVYQMLFFTVASATLGMRYAGICLSTFDGYSPSRAQRCGRLMALPLSILPLGLGLVWAFFDDGHLTWHDRLSKTYLRKRYSGLGNGVSEQHSPKVNATIRER